jgi:hypothetical protein
VALDFQTAMILAVACPSCNAGINRRCSDLGFGAVALNEDAVHPDRVLLYTALAAKPSVWDPAFIIECPHCHAPKTKPCVGIVEVGQHIHVARERAYLAAVERLPPRSGNDPVNHPAHYNAHPAGIECIDVVEHMTFNVGSAMKYLWRAGLKGGSPRVEDLKKAAWYINREIEKLTKEKKGTP